MTARARPGAALAAAFAACSAAPDPAGPLGSAAYLVVTVEPRPAVAAFAFLEVALDDGDVEQQQRLAVPADLGDASSLDFSVDVGGRVAPIAVEIAALDASRARVGWGETTALPPCAASDPATCQSDPACEFQGGACAVRDGVRAEARATVRLYPDDFQVNQQSGGNQYISLQSGARQVGADALGRFVVVWEDDCPPENANRCDIWARPFDEEGRAAGDQFVVNTGEAVTTAPAVAMDEDGRFAAAWQSLTDSRVFARVFAPGGDPVAPPLVIETGATSYGSGADLAALPGGGFALAWIESRDDFSEAVMVCRLEVGGDECADSIRADDAPLEDGEYIDRVALAADPASPTGDARLLVVWQVGTFESSWLVARLLSAVPGGFAWVGPEFRLPTDAGQSACDPDVAAADGVFWVGYAAAASDCWGDDEADVALLRYDRNGVALQVFADFARPGRQHHVAVAARAGGLGFVAWETAGTSDEDGTPPGVRAATVEASGKVQADFAVNTTTGGAQTRPSAMPGGGDSFVVAFQDGSAAGPDQEGTGIRARIVYEP